MAHKANATWIDGLAFNSNAEGGKINLDADTEVGGQGKGIKPKALMLNALAGCTGMDVASLIKKMRLTVSDFKVEVEGELTEEHPKYYDKVKVTYHFEGENLNHEKLNKAVNLSVERYCGVFEMFRRFAKIETEIFFNS